MDLAGRELKVESGRLAGQANGSVVLTYGETTVLATATMSQNLSRMDYFPLNVEYEEKFYAAGKIKSGRFIKREGRTSDDAVLTGRMIDRVLRPLFNKKIRNEIQVVLTVLSFDRENDPDIPALIAASLALGISDIPFNGPVAGLRVGQDGEEWILNPNYKIREESNLELIVAGKGDKINMLEGEANQVPEETIIKGIEFSLPHLKKLVEFQEKIIQEIGLEKKEMELKEIDSSFKEKVEKWLEERLEKVIFQTDRKGKLDSDVDALKEELIISLTEGMEENEKNEKVKWIEEILEDAVDQIVHQNVLKSDKRVDGRKLDQVREIKSEVGVLARTHGSGIFDRGQTQALSIVTLGSPGDEQTVETMEKEYKKRFIHHYNFPPFSVGEARPMRGPGRREIGHGSLAEKALLPLIPDKEKFPYTIRLVSEILSSNGSSSMASVSGSSLAMMDAGIPIRDHVSGIAMGLMSGSDEYKILTDIQGPEDHYGDMDCKIAGTKLGMTACQMDVKIEGVSLEILEKTFKQSREARKGIIGEMEKAIKEPRKELSPFAPRIISLKINPDKIRIVIGPGGKTINEIVDQTGVKIDIEDDGTVNITSEDGEAGEKALEWVKSLTREVKVGETFMGKVVKILEFGAFVKILPDQDGLLHISEISNQRIERVEDVLKLDQEIKVKVKNVDESGKVSLTLKGVDSK